MVDTFLGTKPGDDGVIAITDDAVVVANPDAAAVEEVACSIASGAADPPGARRIPFAVLTSVHTDKRRCAMQVRYWDGRTTQATHLTFADPRSRDRALVSLTRRFGDAFRREEEQYGLVRAVGVPLVWTIGMLFFTWVLIGAAQELAGGAPIPARHALRAEKVAAAGVLAAIGPVGALLIGASATLSCLRWTLARWRKPPFMVRLVRC